MAKDAAWIPTAGFHTGRGGGGGNKHFHVEHNENWPTRCHCCSREIQQPGDFSGHNLRLGVENWLQWGSTNRNSGYSSSLSQTLHMPTPLKRNPTAPPTQMPPVAPSLCHLFPACCPAASCQIPMLDGIRLIPLLQLVELVKWRQLLPVAFRPHFQLPQGTREES